MRGAEGCQLAGHHVQRGPSLILLARFRKSHLLTTVTTRRKPGVTFQEIRQHQKEVVAVPAVLAPHRLRPAQAPPFCSTHGDSCGSAQHTAAANPCSGIHSGYTQRYACVREQHTAAAADTHSRTHSRTHVRKSTHTAVHAAVHMCSRTQRHQTHYIALVKH
jgi:hypothetical protein